MLFGIALACLPINIDSALAHNTLESSTPADDSELTESPQTWILSFTKPVPLDSASGQLIDSSGIRTSLGQPVHGASENVIVFALPQQLIGQITARWRLVGVDGHVISGRVNFAITQPESTAIGDTPPPTNGATNTVTNTAPPAIDDLGPPLPQPISILLRLADLVLLFGLLGLFVVERAIAQGTSDTRYGALIVRFGPIGLIVTGLVQALSFTAEIQETSIFGSITGIPTALETTPGAMLFMQPLLMTLIALQLRSRHRTIQRAEVMALVLTTSLFLVARAYTGHPRSEGWPLIGIPLELAHTAFSGVWLGGLVVLLLCVLPAVSSENGIAAFRQFGKIAVAAVPAILLTGIAQTVNMHGGLGDITSTSHGRVLIPKLILVSVTMALGYLNHRRMSNRHLTSLSSQANLGLILRVGIIELIFGTAVLASTAVLVNASLG